jgi:hypothetical protein
MRSGKLTEPLGVDIMLLIEEVWSFESPKSITLICERSFGLLRRKFSGFMSLLG